MIFKLQRKMVVIYPVTLPWGWYLTNQKQLPETGRKRQVASYCRGSDTTVLQILPFTALINNPLLLYFHREVGQAGKRGRDKPRA